MARVVVGLSGSGLGVTAHLLLEQGHEVIGIFARNWHNGDVILDDECLGSRTATTPYLWPNNWASPSGD